MSSVSKVSLHRHGSMPHGLGLLTTVASLPPKYRSRYLSIKAKCEIPLDLSVKQISPVIAKDVPMAINFTEVYTEPSIELSNETPENCITTIARTVEEYVLKEEPNVATDTKKWSKKAMSPSIVTIALPIKQKWTDMEKDKEAREYIDTTKLSKKPKMTIKDECTPIKAIRLSSVAPRTVKTHLLNTKSAKNKAMRKLKFDEETSSPVSGTIIRPLEDITDGTVQYSNGDIDPRYNIVEITEETKAELAAIKNVIGDYICKLCRIKFEDAFGLARHRCACIVLLEYRCPECGKQFNCPANLASHRRWHKPKKNNFPGAIKKENRQSNSNMLSITQEHRSKSKEFEYRCNHCNKQFKRLAYLRKHQLTHINEKKPMSTTVPLASVSVMMVDSSSNYVSGNSNGGYQSYASSSTSSIHSFVTDNYDEIENGHNFATHVATNHAETDGNSLTDCSSDSSVDYDRLQIVESGLTEEENIAAAALADLRNCSSVIQHTTMAH